MLEPGDYVIKWVFQRDTRLERTISSIRARVLNGFLDSDRPKISEGKLLVDDQTFSSMLGSPFRVPIARVRFINSSLGEIGETFLGNLVKAKFRPLKSRWA